LKPSIHFIFEKQAIFSISLSSCSGKLIPTAKDQPEIIIEGAGYFLQEDTGDEIAQYILDFIERTSLSTNRYPVSPW
jgi:hypothetical protein